MQILVNTDHNIEGREELSAYLKDEVERRVNRFGRRITRLDVHLSDQNGHQRRPVDKRCVMEARLVSHQRTVVTHHASTLDQAVDGAADKLKRSLESIIDRLQAHR